MSAQLNQSLEKLFRPKSIAVVGASNNLEKVGGIVLYNLIAGGFKGSIYPVNLKSGRIQGLPAKSSLAEVRMPVDLVVVATPASTVLPILEQCGQLGISQVLVFSAGFGELGAVGKELQRRMVKLCDKYGISLLGPNCLGYVDTHALLNVTFGQIMQKKGNFLLLSQSGAIASSIFDWCESSGVGVAAAVTLGNKAVVGEVEVLRHWRMSVGRYRQPRKELAQALPIGMYLESIEKGRDFIETCRILSQDHPLFALKPGKSSNARKAMQSHTGALAGSDDVLEAAFKRAGVMRCSGMEDFFDLTRAFCFENPPSGPRVAVISNAGGPAVLTSDAIEEHGLTMAPLSVKTREILERALPRAASLLNPVDVLGDAMADRYAVALEAVLADEAVDAVVVVLTPQVMTQVEETADWIAQLSRRYAKPILASFIGGRRVSLGEKILTERGIPAYRFPERAIYALSALWRWQQLRTRATHELPLVSETSQSNFKYETYDDVLSLVRRCGLKMPRTSLVETLTAAEDFWDKTGGSSCLKIQAKGLLHKVDIGAVKLGISSKTEMAEEWRKMQRLKKQLETRYPDAAIYAQKQVEPGIELLVGVKNDVSFGKVGLLGAGGTLAEVLAEIRLGFLPMGRREIRALLSQMSLYRLLVGYRGERAFDIDLLVSQIETFFQLCQREPAIFEAETNPMIVNRSGVWAVDIKVMT